MKDSICLLMSIREGEAIVKTLIDEKERLYSQACKITQNVEKDRVQGGNGGSKVESIIPSLIELQEKLEAKREMLSRAENVALDCILEMDKEDPKDGLIYAKLILMYYFEGIKWEQCAESIGYTKQWIFKKRDKALELFEKIYQRKKEAHEIDL